MAGMTGPAAPIVAGIGIGLGMIAAMLGDPKQIRETAITREIRDALYMAPPSVSVQSDITGARTRTNRAGQIDSTPWDAFRYQVNDPYYIRGPHNNSNLEQVPGTVIYLTIPINAMDAKTSRRPCTRRCRKATRSTTRCRRRLATNKWTSQQFETARASRSIR
jgi:hypothetical protein